MLPEVLFRRSRLLIAGLFLLIHPAAATAATNISFVPASSELACNNARAIDVHIDGLAEDLRGLSLVIGFDDGIIEPLTVERGQLLTDAGCGSFLNWNNELTFTDTVFVDAAGLGCSVDGPGPVVRIWFAGVSDGLATIEVQSAILRDSLNQPIAWTSTPAQIIVSCPVPVASRSWTALKGHYR